MDGYIKLHRKILEWGWYGDIKTKTVFLHLLLLANFKESVFQGEKIKRGQCIVSMRKLGCDLGLSVNEIRTALKHLKNTKEITVKSTHGYSVINIESYGVYQLSDETQAQTDHTANTQQAHSKHMQTTTSEERKKERKKQKKKGTNVPQKEKAEAVRFADFVSMTNAEYQALVAELGESGAERCVEILDNYKGSSGKKYKSDYRAILNWVVGRYEQELGEKASGEATSVSRAASVHAERRKPKIGTIL